MNEEKETAEAWAGTPYGRYFSIEWSDSLKQRFAGSLERLAWRIVIELADAGNSFCIWYQRFDYEGAAIMVTSQRDDELREIRITADLVSGPCEIELGDEIDLALDEGLCTSPVHVKVTIH
jgi:hypothetical protein